MTSAESQALILAGFCPICRNGPYRQLLSHVTPIHGIDRFEFRERFGFEVGETLCDEPLSMEYRSRRVRRAGLVVQANGCGQDGGSVTCQRAADEGKAYRIVHRPISGDGQSDATQVAWLVCPASRWPSDNVDHRNAAGICGGCETEQVADFFRSSSELSRFWG